MDKVQSLMKERPRRAWCC